MQEIFFQQFDIKKREKVDLVILWPIITYIEDLKIFRYMGNFLVIGYSRASIAGLSIDRSVNKSNVLVRIILRLSNQDMQLTYRYEFGSNNNIAFIPMDKNTVHIACCFLCHT